MKPEIEVKFLHVDFETIHDQLRTNGAVCTQPMRLMRRVVMDFPGRSLQNDKSAWVRIRDEGNKITLTYKQATEHVFGGASEIEIDVSSYEDSIALLQSIGLVVYTDQETNRETWILDNVEIVLDDWPWLDSYIEIEGATKEAVKEVAAKLRCNWDEAVFGSVSVAYREQYPAITSDQQFLDISEIKFNTPKPEWFTKGKNEAN